MSLNLIYTMVQKSQKWPKTQIKGGGPALTVLITEWLRPRSSRQLFHRSRLWSNMRTDAALRVRSCQLDHS